LAALSAFFVLAPAAGAATVAVPADQPTIQQAVDAANPNDTVSVAAGTYHEDVTVTKPLTLQGAGSGSTTVSGVIGGVRSATFTVSASNVTIDGFTITRDGNDAANWSNGSLNSAGVAILGQALTGLVVSDNVLSGNRTAIDINNSSGNSVLRNVIDGNRTGLVFRNQTDNTSVVNNAITNNYTLGIVFLDASSGSNSPLQQAAGSTFANNKISGNWYAQVVDRQTGGSLPAPGANVKNFSNNWFGSASPAVTTADSTEGLNPSVHPQIYGGGDVAPGGQPDIAGPASGNLDITPLLRSGSDTSGASGFQGDFSSLGITASGAQSGVAGRITEGVGSLTSGGTLHVGAGTFNENVAASKPLTLQGAGSGSTTISAPIGAATATITVGASDVTVDGVKVTRAGNNVTDWNGALSNAGIAIQGLSITGTEIEDSWIVGNRTAIDVNNSGGHSIHDNLIENNHTGLIFRNQTDGLSVTGNEITGNRTVGVLFIDASGGTNSPPQQAASSEFTGNDISGNWYGQVVDRQAGGSLPAAGTNKKDFSGNYLGTTSPVVTTANSAEPGYASLIPASFGGSAPVPTGQPDVAGPGSANVDFTPLLASGTDTSPDPGFQGDDSSVVVTAQGAQVGAAGRVQEGIDTASSGGTVAVKAGTYGERPTVGKTLTLQGANAGVDARGARGAESVLDGGIVLAADGIALDGFEVTGADSPGQVGIVANGHHGQTIENDYVHGNEQGLHIDNASGAPSVIRRNRFADNTGPGQGTAIFAHGAGSIGLLVEDNAFSGHTVSATNFGHADDLIVRDNTSSGDDSFITLQDSSDVTISGNTVTGGTGSALFNSNGNANVTITRNTVKDPAGSGTSALRFLDLGASGGGNTGYTVTENTFAGYAYGVRASAGTLGATLPVHRNRIVGFTTGVDNATGQTIDAKNNWWGSNAGAVATTGASPISPRLVATAVAAPGSVQPGGIAGVSVTLAKNSDGDNVDDPDDADDSPVPPTPVAFSEVGGPLGSIAPPTSGTTDKGLFGSIFTAGSTPGTATLRATVDGQTLDNDVVIVDPLATPPGDGAAEITTPGDTVSTGSTPDASDPVGASVGVPAGGTGGLVTIEEKKTDDLPNDAPQPPSTYSVVGTQVEIHAPDQTRANPLVLTFVVHKPASSVTPDAEVKIFRNGGELANCTPYGTATSVTAPAIGCVKSRVANGDDLTITVLTAQASLWAIGAPALDTVFESGPGVAPTSQYTNDVDPTFEFHAENASVETAAAFECQVDAVDVPASPCGTPSPTNGTDPASYTLAAFNNDGTDDGPHTFTAQANDGFAAGPPEDVAFFLDTRLPTIGAISGPPAKSGITANAAGATFTFTTGDPGGPNASGVASVECSRDGAPFAACVSGTNYGTQVEGPHSFQVKVTDNAGNVKLSPVYDWEVDVHNPDTAITPPLPGNTGTAGTYTGPPSYATASDAATFTFTATDAPYTAGFGNRFECRLDGGSWVACNSGTKSYTGLSHGSHTFDVRAVDDATNTDPTSASHTWFVDLKAPVATEGYPYAGGRFSFYKDVKATYSCAEPSPDVLSGVAPVGGCVGTVPVGTPFDHTSLGTPTDSSAISYPWTIDTKDNVGNLGHYPSNYRIFTFAGLVLDDNPLLYYRLNDTDSTMLDRSGNHHDGEYKNATSSGPEGISGDGNHARVFTGEDGYGFVNNVTAPTHDYTLSAFVRFDTADDGMIAQHGGGGALFRRGNALVFRQVDTDVELTVPGGIIPGCWYFVAGRWTGGTATIYAGTHDDGPLDCTPSTTDLEWFSPVSLPSTKAPSGTATFYVGYGDQAPWLHGALDEVAYFGHVLSPTHIKEIWLADPPPARKTVTSEQPPANDGAGTGSSDPGSGGGDGGGSAPASGGGASAGAGAAGGGTVAVASGAPTAKVPASKAKATTTSAKAKAAAAAKAKALSKSLAKAKAKVKALKRRHASRKSVKAAQAKVTSLTRQLRTAKARAAGR